MALLKHCVNHRFHISILVSMANVSHFLMKHFANAGFPCPIMQSPSDHFLRAINTDFDRIIAMCKNWQVTHNRLVFISSTVFFFLIDLNCLISNMLCLSTGKHSL